MQSVAFNTKSNAMKSLSLLRQSCLKFAIVVFATILSLSVLAQTEVEKSHGADGFATSDSAMETVPWYGQPWFWALAAAALVLIIGYLARRGGRVEKTPERGVDY